MTFGISRVIYDTPIFLDHRDRSCMLPCLLRRAHAMNDEPTVSNKLLVAIGSLFSPIQAHWLNLHAVDCILFTLFLSFQLTLLPPTSVLNQTSRLD
jgi:hypothetical protein